MLYSLDLGDSLADLRGLATGDHANTCCGQDILEVVRAFEMNIRSLQHGNFFSVSAKDDLIAAKKRSCIHFLLAAKPRQRRFDFALQVGTGRVVGVQDSEITGLLVLEDSRLRVYVGLKRVVAVEMVRSDIQDSGNPRTELLNALELEAGNFQDYVAVRRGLINQRDHRRADVSADERLLPALGENLADQ